MLLFIYLFFYNIILTLTTLRFLSWGSLHTLHYTTYSIFKIQLIFKLLTLFYLHYVQCDNAHIFRGTSFTHTKKEKLIHKKLTATKDKKAKLWVGLIRVRVRAWKKNPKVKCLAKIDFQRLKINIRRVRDSLRAASHLEPACKLYSNHSAWGILSHFRWNLFCESVMIVICLSISKLYFSCCTYSLIDGDMFLNLQQ